MVSDVVIKHFLTADSKSCPKILEISPSIPLPLRWGRVGVGADKKNLPPSPSSPPTRGGEILGGHFIRVREKFSGLNK